MKKLFAIVLLMLSLTLVLAQASATLELTPSSYGINWRNRIINGDMRIDQRNSGAVQSSLPSSSTYTVDRWAYVASQASKFNSQQNAGAVAVVSGFTKYLGLTVASVYTVLTGDYFIISQTVEGLNMADFQWGTSSAQSASLSFWVYTSVTGTHSGALRNGSGALSYPFTFSVPVANTWTRIAVSIPGPTTGTWASDNTAGIILDFSLGVGATFSSTAGSWQAGNYFAVTGAVSVVGNVGATFYVTGVQLEQGTTATQFERRPYGLELTLAQRYFEIGGTGATANYAGGSTCAVSWRFTVPKRGATIVSLTTTIPVVVINGTGLTGSGSTISAASSSSSSTGQSMNITGFTFSGGEYAGFMYSDYLTASAEF